MEPMELWNQFEKSGKIDDYLNYKKNSQIYDFDKDKQENVSDKNKQQQVDG